MTSERVEAPLSGKTEGGTMATGAKANNMDSAYLPVKIIKLREANGSMAGRSGGSINSNSSYSTFDPQMIKRFFVYF
jgi:hypothetical protein